MALLECEECGGKVSDRAAACPHCGLAVADMTLATCEECGGAVSDNDDSCPHCGFPLPELDPEPVPDPEPSPSLLSSAAKLQPIKGLDTAIILGLMALALVRAFNMLLVVDLPNSADPMELVAQSETLDGVVLVGTAAVGILFLIWQSTVSTNARLLRGDEVRGPAWVFSWFLPMGNLFMPYLAVRDAWRATVTNEPWQRAKPGASFGIWWSALISAVLLSQVSQFMWMSETTTLDEAVGWSSSAGIAFVVAAFACGTVVSQISERQNTLRSQALDAGELLNA